MYNFYVTCYGILYDENQILYGPIKFRIECQIFQLYLVGWCSIFWTPDYLVLRSRCCLFRQFCIKATGFLFLLSVLFEGIKLSPGIHQLRKIYCLLSLLLTSKYRQFLEHSVNVKQSFPCGNCQMRNRSVEKVVLQPSPFTLQ